MPDRADSAKGRFGALFGVCLKLTRFVLGCACTFFFAPYAILGILLGGDILVSLDWGWPVGLLMFAWGFGGVIGLVGYLACGLGFESRFNALLRFQAATSFALTWGVLSASWLVAMHLEGAQEGRRNSLQDNLLIGLLTFLIGDAAWMMLIDFCRRRLRDRG